MRFPIRVASLATIALAGAMSSSDAAAQCISGGTGGAIPASGTGDGTFDTVLPSFPFTSTLAVTIPSGATCLKSVKLNGVTHTWGGDMQFVLESPGGVKVNLICDMPVDNSNDFGGSYEIVDPVQGLVCPTPVPQFSYTNGNPITSGTYTQNFGGYTSGNNGIVNVGIESIAIASGNWTLTAYDWVGFDSGAITDWELCFGTPTPPPASACVAGGAGGFYPASGAVTGTWDSILPTGQLVAPLAVTVPAGSTKIVSVKLSGLTHTWGGDTHVVLQDPSGNRYNLLVVSDSTSPGGGGCATPLSGDYELVDAVVGQLPCAGGPAPALTCGSFPAGVYLQAFSTWTSGNAGLANTPLESIPIASGTWNLEFYDWYPPADGGNLANWQLCFDANTGPIAYCAPLAGGTSNGCLPSISATGNPNVAHSNSCVITVANVEGQQSGIVFYGVTGPTSTPWCAVGGNSFLCVKAPLERTAVQNAGGTLGLCDGTFVVDFNAFQIANPGSLGNPWSAGDKVDCQGWFRDPPSCKTTFMSEALELTTTP